MPDEPYKNEDKAALRPLIISASRTTDIPAFHSPWFMTRLREAFVDKLNPYNQKLRRISFCRVRAVFFWTKNPAPLLRHLPEIIEKGIVPIFLFTLNDYESEGWEPNLPPLDQRIDTFIRLAAVLPPGSVAWRFDPIALSTQLSPETLLKRALAIHRRIGPFIEKLIFSFITLYPKVDRRLKRLGLNLREPAGDEKRYLLNGLANLKLESPRNLRICACAAEEDLKAYGIERSSCIDAELLARFCPDLAANPELFLPTDIGGLFFQTSSKPLKDSGQRPRCNCSPSRDIGRYNSCAHGCVYCYANK